jgi:hypothetical protein
MRNARLGLALLCATASLGAGAVYAAAGDGPQPLGPPSDPTPGKGPRSMQAAADTPRGRMTVLLYRNKDGQRCVAAGRNSSGTLNAARPQGRGHDVELPLSQVGTCNLRPTPVAFKLEHSREGIVIYGLAAADVTQIDVDTGDHTVSTQPSADDAFIVSVKDIGRRMVVHHDNGQSEVVALPQLPNLDELTRNMREDAKEHGL